MFELATECTEVKFTCTTCDTCEMEKISKSMVNVTSAYPGVITRKEHLPIRLQLHGAIYRPDSFVLMLRHYVNLKAIRYESMSLNRIAADKSHSVIAA